MVPLLSFVCWTAFCEEIDLRQGKRCENYRRYEVGMSRVIYLSINISSVYSLNSDDEGLRLAACVSEFVTETL
jgi:hypothetical protein